MRAPTRAAIASAAGYKAGSPDTASAAHLVDSRPARTPDWCPGRARAPCSDRSARPTHPAEAASFLSAPAPGLAHRLRLHTRDRTVVRRITRLRNFHIVLPSELVSGCRFLVSGPQTRIN